jgi:hypothetical protein
MNQDDEYVPISRSNLDALMDLLGDHEHDERVRQAAYREGKADAPRDGYQAGRDLGHDTGLSARQGTRGYVHGILDGWAAGCEERHRLTEQLLRETAPGRDRPERQVSEQWAKRPAAARDAEAWGGRGPSGSYTEWVAEGREPEPEREAG